MAGAVWLMLQSMAGTGSGPGRFARLHVARPLPEQRGPEALTAAVAAPHRASGAV